MGLRRIQYKSLDEFVRMREAGLVVANTLGVLREAVRPGISTAELDEIAAREISAAGATPSFLGYFGYPATICTSVNEVIVHGIPREDVVLKNGDIISIDCGAILDGWHGDAAFSVGVGDIDPADQALLDACEAALWAGVARAYDCNRLGDVSHAVERSIRESGDYGLIEEYTGHGIGTEMHMDPVVPNFGPPGVGPRLRAGMAICIEPMITRGSRLNAELDDGWTVVSSDGSRAAHFEHTVAITPEGPWVLTAPESGQNPFAERVGVSLRHHGDEIMATRRAHDAR
ncbi:MAG TPA: type I methionyl aminopeptidase [Trebonia sp.]|jgi:methionyl aminopeptidase|nr:type I methionyl aminopeptidase [Trebonia sp.]